MFRLKELRLRFARMSELHSELDNGSKESALHPSEKGASRDVVCTNWKRDKSQSAMHTSTLMQNVSASPPDTHCISQDHRYHASLVFSAAFIHPWYAIGHLASDNASGRSATRARQRKSSPSTPTGPQHDISGANSRE